MNSGLDDFITQLAQQNAIREQEKRKKEEENKTAQKVEAVTKRIYVWSPFNIFRFSLAALLVAGKIGVVPATASVVTAPWWLILLPAYVLELGAAAIGIGIILILLVAAVVTGVSVFCIETFRKLLRSRKN